MRVTDDRAAAVALEDAVSHLAHGQDATPDAKTLTVAVILAGGLGDSGPWSEADLAIMSGQSRHQARQAIACLVRDEFLERGWDVATGKPQRRYRVKVEA